MFSRNHKQFHNVKHIITHLRPLFDANPDIILDGELYSHRFRDNFNKIISLVRKQTPSQQDKFQSASYLEYHCYDCFSNNDPWLLYGDRYQWLKDNLPGKSVKLIDNQSVWTDNGVNYYHKLNKEAGYEGSMLRKNTEYQQTRSWSLQKVKEFQDDEFKITGFVEGRGKFKGGLGKFIGVDRSGRDVEVPFQRCTIQGRRDLWNARDRYINKWATFEFFERTPDGNYRFPQFKALRNYE